MLSTADQPATRPGDAELAEQIVLQAYEQERLRRRAPLPRWLPLAMRLLPKVLLAVTILNLLTALLAVAAPLLRAALGRAATAPLYSAYSLICPQRPSHTDFLAGEPMAMEQRMVAMYLAAGLAGLLYQAWVQARRPLPTWLLIAGVAPALIDVALSTWDIRASTHLSRWWTGSLAALAIVCWAYPRFAAQLRSVQAHIARLRAERPA